MFNVTRPQSTLFLIIIAVIALLLLMLPTLSQAGSSGADRQETVGKNLREVLSGRQKTPRALAGLEPVPPDWRANAARNVQTAETETAEADIFFDLDREVTVDSDLLKGSAGVQINW